MILERALPTEKASHGKGPPGSLRSPGLNWFRRNPFRVLRLSASATSKEAVWKADKALALARVGMPSPGVDPLPWLLEADELEIQQAAQSMEEPLRRLVEQLLWFDFDADPRGEILQSALRGDDPEALTAALTLRHTDPTTAPAEATSPGAPLGLEAIAAFARRRNDANLRLILALAALHRIGPRVPTPAREAPAKADGAKPQEVIWTELGGLRVVDNPHALVRSVSKGSGASRFKGLLRDALTGWAQILQDGAFAGYLIHQITQLGDELVGAGDVETLVRALSAELAGIIADEIKLFALDGRMDRTSTLAQVAAESGVAAEVWIDAFRPLRHLFRAELDELGSLVDDSAPPNLENIELYLRRVHELGEQWKSLDGSGLLGLTQMVDEAVGLAFERLRALQEAGALRDQIARILPIQQLLKAAKAVACSKSLKERLGGYAERIDAIRGHLCHFCRERPASDYPAIIVGKTVISRTRQGNTVTTKHQIRRSAISRCEPCSEYHDIIASLGNVLGGLLLIESVILIFLALSR